jgi:hypothetical protein
MPKFTGITIKLGGEDFVVPGLNLRLVRRLTVGLDVLKTGSELEQLDLMVELIHGALVRNYPDMTRDALEELLDSSTAPQVFAAILRQSGFGRDADPKAVAAP